MYGSGWVNASSDSFPSLSRRTALADSVQEDKSSSVELYTDKNNVLCSLVLWWAMLESRNMISDILLAVSISLLKTSDGHNWSESEFCQKQNRTVLKYCLLHSFEKQFYHILHEYALLHGCLFVTRREMQLIDQWLARNIPSKIR